MDGLDSVARRRRCYDGQDGPLSFTVTVTHNAASKTARVVLARMGQLPLSGAVTATVKDSSGAPVTDPALVLMLYGTWKQSPSSPAATHVLATASPVGGSVRFSFHVPAAVAGTRVKLQVLGRGATYRPVTSAALSVKVG